MAANLTQQVELAISEMPVGDKLKVMEVIEGICREGGDYPDSRSLLDPDIRVLDVRFGYGITYAIAYRKCAKSGAVKVMNIFRK